MERLRSNIFKGTEEDYSDIKQFFQDNRQFWVDNTILYFPRWKWMFFNNPNATYPNIWLYKKDGKILAHQASIPFQLKVDNVYYSSAWGVKIIVTPEYQNKGIGTLLTEEWTANIDIPVVLGVRTGSHKMYMKSGWTDIGRMPSFVKLLDAKYLIQKHIRNSFFAHIIGSVVNLYLRLDDYIKLFRTNDAIAHKVVRFDQTIDELWERASVHYDVIAKRDSAYLNWKYADDPNIPYTLLKINYKGEAIGYAVLVNSKENNIRVGYIFDFLAEPQYIKHVMNSVLKYLKNQDIQKVYLRILCKRLENILRKIGFYQRGDWVQMVVKRNNKVPESVGDPHKWFITIGDSDLTDGEIIDTLHLKADWI